MKILLIDDDVDICQLTKTVLTTNGHEVWAFTNPEQGIAHGRRSKPNLILMDVMLPGLSGPEIIHEIKNEAAFKDVPVVFLTGLVTGRETKQDESMAVGGVRYPTLGKPYEIEQLLDIVKRYAR